MCLVRRKSNDTVGVFSYLKGFPKEGGQQVFSYIAEGRMQMIGFQWQQSRFSFDTRENFLMVRAVTQWTRLPREAVESTSLQGFRSIGEGSLRNSLLAFGKPVDQITLVVLSNSMSLRLQF